MTILPEPVLFEWDSGNADKNQKKHDVSIKESEEVFVNLPRYLFVDEKHSGWEKRFGMFGKTNTGRFLSLVFTIRRDVIRIITVRPMSRRERRAYEKIKTNTEV